MSEVSRVTRSLPLPVLTSSPSTPNLPPVFFTLKARHNGKGITASRSSVRVNPERNLIHFYCNSKSLFGNKDSGYCICFQAAC